MKTKLKLLFMSTILGLMLGTTFANHDADCRNTPGVNLAYAAHRFEAGDMTAALERIPPEQLLVGPDWQFFINQNNTLQSFMYPPQWRASILPADALAGDSGVRLDAPDGSAAFELLLDGASPFSARGYIALEDVAAYALGQVLRDSNYQVLCRDNAVSSIMASTGIENVFVAVSSPTHYAIVKAVSFRGVPETSLFYSVYAGPKEDFENLVRYVFGPVINSFPKGGGGGCSCDTGEPDRDNDGTCDRCDDYPDDPNRQ